MVNKFTFPVLITADASKYDSTIPEWQKECISTLTLTLMQKYIPDAENITFFKNLVNCTKIVKDTYLCQLSEKDTKRLCQHNPKAKHRATICEITCGDTSPSGKAIHTTEGHAIRGEVHLQMVQELSQRRGEYLIMGDDWLYICERQDLTIV